MSYNVQVRIYQVDTKCYFYVVEEGVWKYANGGTWEACNGSRKLTMGGSGTSGMLRFKSDGSSEAFVVALGVHNYKPWVDIVTNLANDVTAVSCLPEYYNDQDPARVKAREAQRDKYSVKNNQGRTISAGYYPSPEGHNLTLNIVIGDK
ncbi:hypothetical protein MY11210_009598 [Beauveria gryllotalpidicola]